MFFNRKRPEPEPEPPEVDLTEESYYRWLRAQRPPLPMFLEMSELEQETLARLGDNYVQDVAVAIGYAVHDPRTADEGLSAAEGDTDAEAALAQKIALGLMQKLQGTREAAPQATPVENAALTMAGSVSRGAEPLNGTQKVRKLFGKEAD